MSAVAPLPAQPAAGASLRWALLAGNFAIGCGVMVVAGSLNDLVRSLRVSVALGGQLITVASAVMAIGAPLLVAVVGRIDRRRLLTLSLLWYAAGHALSALMPDYAWLTPVRGASMLAAAVFTPQAAAAVGWLTPPEQRGRAITFIFLGWSVASVFGMPMHAYIGETVGWRWAFGLVALLSLAAALWVRAAMPAGVRPPVHGAEGWAALLRQPVLLGVVAVTALSGAGQFTVFSYFAPYYREVLGAGPGAISGLFFWFGLFGLIGNLLLSRYVDRFGPARSVTALLALIALSLLVWPLAASLTGMALVIVPWALGCFSSNSAQQARLGLAAPGLAPVLMALNTSAIYLGQAIGAASGGAVFTANDAVGRPRYDGLHWLGLAWLLLALGLSLWTARRMKAAARA